MTSPASTGLALPGLALPRPGSTANKTPGVPSSNSTPLFGAPQKPIGSKKRRKKLLHNASSSNLDHDRALDEADDVDENEWKMGQGDGSGVPGSNKRKRTRVVDEEYGDEGDEDGDREGGADVDMDMDDDAQVEQGEDGGEENEEEGDGVMERGGGGQGGDALKIGLGEDERIKQRDKKAKGERLALRSVLDEEQARRFDAFSTAVIPKQAIKRLNVQMYDQRINDKLGLLLAGMAKIFAADIVELARDIQADSEHPTGPLRLYHLRLAREILERRQVLSTSRHAAGGVLSTRRSMFRR